MEFKKPSCFLSPNSIRREKGAVLIKKAPVSNGNLLADLKSREHCGVDLRISKDRRQLQELGKKVKR